jgi:hypothetical protein
MSNVILAIVFVVSLVLYVLRRRARLQVEEASDNY